ncbi:MAG TPA: DPP IV N-terminal domain-containing protein [Longimicrobiales bacterium]|nr:DPP IV N-terminal domain-containing protein [Longimicrobiales bacterium]
MIPRTLLWLVLLPATAAAQGTRDDYTRAERFLPQNLNGLVLNGQITANWVAGEDRFWYVRELPDGKEFVVVDAASGRKSLAFDHERLAEALARALDREVKPRALPFDRFDFTAGGSAIEFAVAAVRWRCDLARSVCTRSAPVPAANRALSPDGKWLAFVREHNLYVRSTENGAEMQLTTDGVPGYSYATPIANPGVMVREHAQEPVQDAAVSWSPDSRRLTTFRLDTRRARTLTMVQHAPPDNIRPEFYTYVYPLAQDTVLPSAEPLMFEIASRRRVAAQIPPVHQYYYGGPTFRWSADGREFYVNQVDRGYTHFRLTAVDTLGVARVVVDERGVPWYNSYATVSPTFLADGREVLFASERDGWMHLYLYDGTSGRLKGQVTRGPWVVRGVARVDEKARTLYFLAGGREPGRDPYLQHLYKVRLDGSGLQLLTPEPADHAISFSPSGAYFVDSYSRADLAPVAVLRRASDGAVISELERAHTDRLRALGWKEPEPFKAVARDGKTEIYGLIWRPTNFDPSRRYPLVEQIYTGPQSFFVPKNFSAWRNHAQTVAELGFIVVQIDALGTARRSREFHNWSYKNLGDGGFADRIGAFKQLAATYPYIDLTRVGVYGHSAGGYDAARALLTHPEFYKVGVSSAGNHDHRLDKAVWNTQWMGWPLGPHYDEQSNVAFAGNLKGKLLLAHGDLDDNVPVSATLRLVDALIRANKEFDMLIVPNANHGVGSTPYFIKKRWDYLVRHLLGVEPPQDFRIAAGSTQ